MRLMADVRAQRMGIEVAWVDERHEVKQIVGDSHGVVSRLAQSRWPKLSNPVCLRFVVPWGDAVFNQAQNVSLVDELRAEIREASDPKVRIHLQKILRLVELGRDEVHTYIKFIGD
jgi:hypothetical protein